MSKTLEDFERNRNIEWPNGLIRVYMAYLPFLSSKKILIFLKAELLVMDEVGFVLQSALPGDLRPLRDEKPHDYA